MRLRAAIPLYLLASTSCFGLLSATASKAEEASSLTVLDPVVLYSDRQGKTLRDSTQAVDVADSAEIKARNIDDLESLTRYMPGVSASRQVSAADPFGGSTSVQIRGVEGNRIQFQIDGGRVPERIMDGSRDYLDFNFTKQAEVLRGPASVLWGADALGGVVALRTIGAEDVIAEGGQSGLEVNMGFSSLDRAANMALAYGLRLSDSTQLLLAHSRGTNEEIRLKHAPADGGAWGCNRPIAAGSVDCGEFNPLNRISNRTLLKLEHQIDDGQKLTFSFDQLKRRSEVDIRTSLGGATNYVLENRRSRDNERTRYGIDYEVDFASGPVESLTTTLSYSPSGYQQRGTQRRRLVSGEYQTQYDTLDYSEDFLELDVQGKSSFTLGGAEHRLTWGFDADQAKTRYDVTRRQLNHTTGVTEMVTAGGFNFADGTTTRADIYIQDEISFADDRFVLTPGLRYATYQMTPRVNSVVAQANPSFYERKSEKKLLGSLGATAKLNDTYSIWAHYGEGFKMPTFQQLFTSSTSGSYDLVPAPWLKPETVKSLELGLRGDYGDSVWSVNAFKADYTDFIESFWFVPNTNDISYRNLSQVRTWGIEAEGAWQVNTNLRLSGSLAWMKGKAKSSPTAAETVHVVPPLTATLGMDYTLDNHDLTLSANALVAGSMTSKPGNFAPSGYGVLDVAAKWGVAQNASLNLGINNLFDRAYYTQGAAGSSLASTAATNATVPPGLFTGAGRNFTLNLEMRF